MWDKPNEFYAILRCTEVKYANMLIDTGSIKFNTPYSWVNRGEKESMTSDLVYNEIFVMDIVCNYT